jgi:hypothetical protein
VPFVIGDCLVREPLDVVILGIVGRDPIRLDAQTGEVFLRLLQVGVLAGRQDDPGSLLTERFCDLQSKSARPAGHECGLSGEVKSFLDATHVWSLIPGG